MPELIGGPMAGRGMEAEKSAFIGPSSTMIDFAVLHANPPVVHTDGFTPTFGIARYEWREGAYHYVDTRWPNCSDPECDRCPIVWVEEEALDGD